VAAPVAVAGGSGGAAIGFMAVSAVSAGEGGCGAVVVAGVCAASPCDGCVAAAAADVTGARVDAAGGRADAAGGGEVGVATVAGGAALGGAGAEDSARDKSLQPRTLVTHTPATASGHDDWTSGQLIRLRNSFMTASVDSGADEQKRFHRMC